MKKEIKAVAKERTIILAIIIQLLIASFSSVILIGLMSFYDPDSIGENTNIKLKVGIVGDSYSPLVGYLDDKRVRTVYFYSQQDAEEEFNKGSIDAILHIPENRSGVTDMKLYLPESDSKSTVILMVLKEPLKKYENYLREYNGVDVKYTDIRGKQNTTYEFLYTFIVPMLMLFPAFIAGSIVIDTLSEEFENKTLDTLLSAPVSLNQMLGAKLTAAVFIAAVQCILWPILLFFNHIYIHNVIPVILLAVIIAAFISVSSGILAIFFKDRERSQFIYSILLLSAGAVTYFLNPSPFSLMARLAAGDIYVGMANVLAYAVPVIVMLILFFFLSNKMFAAKN
nr:ABC transporter permease [Methanocella sp. CWC-04]